MKDDIREEIEIKDAAGKLRHYVLRSLEPAEYEQGVDVQKVTWGPDFAELMPPSMMMIAQKIGGVVGGAFDEGERLGAFVYGLTGVRDGELLHWSHMAAVRPELRGLGLGRHVKLLQRRLVLAVGCRVAMWTYDPLQSRNAHLNLERLGAEPVEYLRDVYGDGSSSPLHRGIGTDRFVVRWPLDDPEVEARIAGRPSSTEAWRRSPLAASDEDGRPKDPPFELPAAERFRVEVPADIGGLKTTDPDAARRWRRATRFAFEAAFACGYRVRGFDYDPAARRAFYLVSTR